MSLLRTSSWPGGVTTIGDCQVTRREFDMSSVWPSRISWDPRQHVHVSHLLDHVIDTGMHCASQFAIGSEVLSHVHLAAGPHTSPTRATRAAPGSSTTSRRTTGRPIAKAHSVGLYCHARSVTDRTLCSMPSKLRRRLTPTPTLIEHCGLPTADRSARMNLAGVYPVNQPQHYYNWGGGRDRCDRHSGRAVQPARRVHRCRSSRDHQLRRPRRRAKPLEAIQAAVTRVTRQGHQLGSDALRITADQALQAHTLNGARALGREAELGSISVGKRADFVHPAVSPRFRLMSLRRSRSERPGSTANSHIQVITTYCRALYLTEEK